MRVEPGSRPACAQELLRAAPKGSVQGRASGWAVQAAEHHGTIAAATAGPARGELTGWVRRLPASSAFRAQVRWQGLRLGRGGWGPRARSADYRRREREAKVRPAAVGWAVWFVGRGLTAETVRAWQAVAAKLRLDAETRATGLARVLEEHGSVDAARKSWSAAIAKLRADHRKLAGEVAAPRGERDGLTAAIGAVREEGIAEVREVADTATAEIRRAAAEFERVSAQAAELGPTLTFAQALRSPDPELWARVEPDAWAGILHRLGQWSAATLANPEVPIPDEVRREAKGSPDYATPYGPFRVPLRGLVDWLRAGIAQAAQEPLRLLLAARAGSDGVPRG